MDFSDCEVPPPTTLRAHMGVEGRLLGPRDLEFLKKAGFPSFGVYTFICPALTRNKDDKWKAAFRQCVKVTPILQCQIVGEGPSAVFTKLPESKWPTIQVHHVESDDDEEKGVIATVEALGRKEVATILNSGSEAARTSNLAIRAHIVLGPRRVAFGGAFCHCFADGIGLGTVSTKTAIYAGLPMNMWPKFDRLSPEEVPSYYEMLLKKDIGVLDEIEDLYAMNKSRPGLDPNNFRFEDYDMTAPGAKNLLQGYQGTLAVLPSSEMDDCRIRLRNAHMTVTSAFGALSVKTLAVILRNRSINLENKPLLSHIPGNGRVHGNWGNHDEKQLLPVVASYVFVYETQIPMEVAGNQDIGHAARLIKENMRELDFNLKARAQNISKLVPNTSRMCLGVTSVRLPDTSALKARLGFEDETHAGYMYFGSLPHIWLNVATHNNITTISADVMLPIEGLTEAEIKMAIKEAVIGSPLEAVFAGMSTGNNKSEPPPSRL